jgi:hypothetical protein
MWAAARQTIITDITNIVAIYCYRCSSKFGIVIDKFVALQARVIKINSYILLISYISFGTRDITN